MVSFNSRRNHYLQVWQQAQVRPDWLRRVDSAANSIVSNKNRYDPIASQTTVPWFVIGLIHTLESNANFSEHLHNGDSLTGRTYRVPRGRPKTGSPPFTFEESALDALNMKLEGAWRNPASWGIAETLFKLEKYNGLGYLNKGIETPYLWSGTTVYSKGKYIRDGVYSASAVSAQVGAAAVLKRMMEKGVLDENFGSTGVAFVSGDLDPGAGGVRTLGGTHVSAGDALAYAVGAAALNRARSHEYNGMHDVASIPDILDLDPQQLFTLKGVAEGLDGEDWVADDIIIYFGSSFQAELVGYKPDPNAPNTNLFAFGGGTAPQIPGQTPPNLVPTGDINQRIYQASLASEGEDSKRSGLGSPPGRLACAWAINTLVLPKAGIPTLGPKNPNYVMTLEEDLKGGRGQLITPRTETQPGDIIIMGKNGRAHVGVTVAAGGTDILSNSSSRGRFDLHMNYEQYDRMYDPNHPCRAYRMLK